ncbi:hypothetical protein ID866_2545 [Astraeus odoratus]|nr:hypothetical protein ID866_2545 [Astraeus odoratus]
MVRVGPPKYTRATPSPTPAEGESWLHMVTPSTSQHSEDSTIDEPLQEKQVEEITSLPRSSMRPANELLRHTTDPQSISHDSTSVPSLYSSVVSHIVAKPSPSISSSPSVSTAHAPYSPTLLSTSSLSYVSCEPMTSPEPTVELSSASPTQLNSGTQVSPPLVSRSSYITSNTTLDSIPSLTKSPAAPASPNLSLESGSSLSNILNEEEEDDDDPSMSSSAAPSATRYVEPELLLGVSLGFQLPVISTVLTPMQGPMPNVITLPYGKPPVLFFQAPSWRRLLKLMARLSGTQIEATLEAMAVAKHDLKLRTVIQFVKVHHSSPEWRTVLYFTTDMPIPPNVRSQHKYTNGDVTVLPFSYTLSALPPLLRDGAESPMAKYYVVPSTPTTPYPVLPINFPNLAMYLQSAVQDSRRAINDGSSGMRKLAHYIDTCYPGDYEGTATLDNEAPRRGVGGMLRRVIGRSRGPRGSRGNEEIYDLVTPFVADEWG